MGITRTFEDFRPPVRHDGIPFLSVTVQESATVDGAYTTIDTLPLSPQDLDPADPQARDLTTSNGTLDPAWYKLIWTDGQGGFFPSGAISSVRRSFLSVADLSAALGRDLSDDEAAGDAIDQACDMVRTYAEQTFTRTVDDTITLDGSGTDTLLLPELPATDVSAVLIDTEAVTDYVLGGVGLLFRKTTTATTNGWVPPSTWPMGRQNITVTYSHGYTEGDIPRDIKAVAQAVATRLLVQGPADSENVQGDSISYSVASTDLTEGEKAILRKYRKGH